MYTTKAGKHFNNPQIGKAHDAAEQHSQKSAHGESNDPHAEGDKGTPHPVTGVHKVEVVHKGNNRFVTRSHSENGQSEQEHEGPTQGVSQAFPEQADNETPDGDVMSPSGNDALQGMMGSDT